MFWDSAFNGRLRQRPQGVARRPRTGRDTKSAVCQRKKELLEALPTWTTLPDALEDTAGHCCRMLKALPRFRGSSCKRRGRRPLRGSVSRAGLALLPLTQHEPKRQKRREAKTREEEKRKRDLRGRRRLVAGPFGGSGEQGSEQLLHSGALQAARGARALRRCRRRSSLSCCHGGIRRTSQRSTVTHSCTGLWHRPEFCCNAN